MVGVKKRPFRVLGVLGVGTMFVAPIVQADRPGLQIVRTICPNGAAPAPARDSYSCGTMVAPKPNDSCRPVGKTEGPYCVWTCGYPAKSTTPRCYDFHGKSVSCPDPDASDTFMCASANYVWLVPRSGGNCDGDPGPEGGIYQAPEAPRQTATFIPPHAIGEIYTVITYKQTGRPAHPWERGSASAPTSLAVGWGGWQPHGVLAPPAAGALGFVLRLHHVATDSVPILIATDGDITSGPSQGPPPSEWTDPGYQHVPWP
jgi:hypothetical protein